MTAIEIGTVRIATHIDAFVQADVFDAKSNKFDRGEVRQETYAGSIELGLSNKADDLPDPVPKTSRIGYKTYLPLFGTNVRMYRGATILQYAALVTPSGWSALDDEAFTCSVDSWYLKLEPQRRLKGEPDCLVLYFEAALLNGTIHRIGYHVTVLINAAEFTDAPPLEGSAHPD